MPLVNGGVKVGQDLARIVILTDPITLTFAALCFLIAGTIKGVVGIGLPTAAIGLMTLLIDPRLAISITLIPMVGSNAWQVWRMGDVAATVRRYKWLAVVLAICVAATTLLSRTVPQEALMAILGGSIVVFVLVSLAHELPKLPDRLDQPAQVVMGGLAGVMGGLTAVWAPPMVMYLTARGVTKDEFVRATGVLIFIGCIPLVWGYAYNGFLTPERALSSTMMLIPTIAGFTLGERIRSRLPAATFKKVLLYVFLILGLNLLRRALF
ncbi:MAG: sulfite exporter TauE/SafE family protein [Litoreibacter sp.]